MQQFTGCHWWCHGRANERPSAERDCGTDGYRWYQYIWPAGLQCSWCHGKDNGRPSAERIRWPDGYRWCQSIRQECLHCETIFSWHWSNQKKGQCPIRLGQGICLDISLEICTFVELWWCFIVRSGWVQNQSQVSDPTIYDNWYCQ